MRANGARPSSRATAVGFIALNRGKKSITCDLGDKAAARGADRAHRRGRRLHPQSARRRAGQVRHRRRLAHQALPAADLCRSRRLRPCRPVEGAAGLRADRPGGGRADLAERRSFGAGSAHRRLDHRPVDRHVDGDRRAGGDRPARRHGPRQPGQHLAVRERPDVGVEPRRELLGDRQDGGAPGHRPSLAHALPGVRVQRRAA